MHTFVAVYRGKDVEHAKVIAVSAHPVLVMKTIEGMIEEKANENPEDPVLAVLKRGRDDALLAALLEIRGTRND